MKIFCELFGWHDWNFVKSFQTGIGIMFEPVRGYECKNCCARKIKEPHAIYLCSFDLEDALKWKNKND